MSHSSLAPESHVLLLDLSLNTALFPVLASLTQVLSKIFNPLSLILNQSVLAEQHSARHSKGHQGGKRQGRPALQELVIQLNTGSLRGPRKLRAPIFSAAEGLGKFLRA